MESSGTEIYFSGLGPPSWEVPDYQIGCWSIPPGLVFLSRGHEGYPVTGPFITARADARHCGYRWSYRGGTAAISLPGRFTLSSKYLLPKPQGKLIVTQHNVKSLSFSFDCTPSLHPQFSASVPPRRLPRTFIRETTVLIKELIFSLLSLISIVNLKHCEFFKFSSLLSKRERERKRWNRGIFNRLSSLPGELDFSLSSLFFFLYPAM